MNSPESSVLASKKRLTAGQVLSARRVKLGLTIEECAETLKLSISKMKAIEADNDAPFSSEIFLRGYLKNYAKLVDLPADDILYYFDAQRQGEASDTENASQNPTQKRHTKGLPYLLAVVIILTWFFVSNQYDLFVDWKTPQSLDDVGAVEIEEKNTPSLILDQQSVIEDSASGFSPLSNILLSTSDETNTKSSDLRTQQNDDQLNGEIQQELNNPVDADGQLDRNQLQDNAVSNQPDSVEQDTEANTPSLSPEGGVSAPDSGLNIDQENPSSVEVNDNIEPLATQLIDRAAADDLSGGDTDSSTVDSSAESPSLSAEPSLVKDLLHFTFSQECWVEVIDATNNKIVSSIRKANTELRVEGRSPFSIILGNINGTSLRFNDEAVALVNSADGRTLRLTVGG